MALWWWLVVAKLTTRNKECIAWAFSKDLINGYKPNSNLTHTKLVNNIINVILC